MAQKQAVSSRLLNLEQVAERTGLALATIRRWASERRIPTVKLSNRVLVAEADLEALIAARRQPACRDIPV